MKITGFDNVYDVNQIIRFQIHVEGYGNSCVGTPEITIYETDQPSIVAYHEKSMSFMCPMEPQMLFFSGDYPSQNDYYLTAIDKEGKYTLHVSYRNTEIEKEFMVKAKWKFDNSILDHRIAGDWKILKSRKIMKQKLCLAHIFIKFIEIEKEKTGEN